MARRSEFVRRVVVEPWPEGGLSVELQADAGERSALARRFDLVELGALAASGRLERAADGREIRFRGQLMADVVQTCVVSLEPVATRILEPIERSYRRLAPGEELPQAAEVLVDPEAVEAEPLPGASIDLGEVLAEELGIALDPYPRRGDAYEQLPELGPDASLDGPEADPAASPFAPLAMLYDHDKRAR